MRKLRFYHQGELKQHQNIMLDDKEFHHIKHVLRLEQGSKIEIFNSDEKVATATITSIGRSSLQAQINSVETVITKSKIYTHLGQVITKSTTMDMIVQKATELGVNKISPITSERTMLKKSWTKLCDKEKHWQSVAISACAQCFRNDIPEIMPPASIDEWLSFEHAGSKLVLDVNPKSSQKGLPNSSSYTLLFGPEGGLSNREIELAHHNGFTSVNLGARILRIETATIAVMSILQYQCGDLK